jgi:hypothetical protein
MTRHPELGPEHQPGWVPDPAYDAMMEEKNPYWCGEHDCWTDECRGRHLAAEAPDES